jgi:predicted phosphate transport protein (TIGR00153 family)
MKMKTESSSLDEIIEEYRKETLEGCKQLHSYLNNFIHQKQKDTKLDEVIECEHNCDRLKEKYIKLLYEDKRALPFLIEDRYNIITMIDGINDRVEFIARFLQINPFELYENISDDFQKLIDTCKDCVTELISLVTIVETSFEQANKKTFKIEELKRTGRTLRFIMLEEVYKQTDNPTRVNLIAQLIMDIYDIISWSEEISDYIRGLIIKYPNR